MAHRTTHATRAINKNGTGKDGFTEGQTVPTPIAATVVTEDILNMLQEEVVGTVEAAGLTPTAGTFTQLLAAIKAFAFRSSVVMALSNFRYMTMTAAQTTTAVCSYDGGASDSIYGARFVAVTTGGYVVETSGPLDMLGGLATVAWASETNISAQNLNAVCAQYSGSTRVAVGNAGVIYTSIAAGTWTSRTSGTANALYGVTSTGSAFAACGATGTVLTSPDGITWTSRTSGTTQAIRAIVHSLTSVRTVAVGDAGTIITSDDYGVTWTARTSGTSNALYGVTWTGTNFIAVGASGTVLTSPDGITWTSRTSGTTANIMAVAYGYGVVVATCDPPDHTYPGILYSLDGGVTWARSPVNIGAGSLTGVAFGYQRDICFVGPSGSFRSLRIPS